MADASADRTTMLRSGQAASDIAALVLEHHAVVYRYALRLSGESNDAEDLTQQTFLIAQQKLHQLREPDRSRSWLLAVTRSCFLKSIRKQRPIAAQDIELTIDNVAAETPEFEIIDREELTAALHELPDEYRLVVLMFYFEDLSYQQIAAQLDLPIGTVMSRLSRAKTRLRQRLSPPEPTTPPATLPHQRPKSASFARVKLG